MVWIDYLIIVIIGLSCLVSWIRGFIHEVLSLAVWGFAFFVVNRYYNYLSVKIISFENGLMLSWIAVVVLFIAVLIVGKIINFIIDRLVEKVGLSGINRMLGIVCVGMLRGFIIVSAALLFFETFTEFSRSKDWHKSQLIPQFKFIIRWIFDQLQNFSSFV